MGPFQGPGRGPTNALKSYRSHMKKKIDTGFPRFDNNPKNIMTLLISGCKAEKKKPLSRLQMF
jgi:hypothetical protein